MQVSVMPDHLYGASVRVNGRWLGVVEAQPLAFTLPQTGSYTVLVELMPLHADPTGDVYPIPFAHLIRIVDGAIAEPDQEPNGQIHIRRVGERHQLHVSYPKTDALGRTLDTLPMQLQTLSADFDRDGRLDTADAYATARAGHVVVRSAKGQVLFQDVYPDNGLRIEVADLTRNGRPDLLIFWQEPGESDPLLEHRLHLWEAHDSALSTFSGFTGLKRVGGGDVLLERKKSSPYRQVLEYYRYSRQPGESAQMHVVSIEAEWRQRAETPEETLDAFLTALELGDERGAEQLLARRGEFALIRARLGHFYSHDLSRPEQGRIRAQLFEWIIPRYCDLERQLDVQLVRQPDPISEWKISAV